MLGFKLIHVIKGDLSLVDMYACVGMGVVVVRQVFFHIV